MEDIIKQKDEEIKRLHEVYDIENVLRQIEVLNEENDKMYEELMMLKNQLYIVKTRFNSYKHRIKSVIELIKRSIHVLNLTTWIKPSKIPANTWITRAGIVNKRVLGIVCFNNSVTGLWFA